MTDFITVKNELYAQLQKNLLENTKTKVETLYGKEEYLKPFLIDEGNIIKVKVPIHDAKCMKCIGLFRILLTINCYNYLNTQKPVEIKTSIDNRVLGFLTVVPDYMAPVTLYLIVEGNKKARLLTIDCNVENVYWKFYKFHKNLSSNTSHLETLKLIERFNYHYRKYHKDSRESAKKQFLPLYESIIKLSPVQCKPVDKLLDKHLPMLKTNVNCIKKELFKSLERPANEPTNFVANNEYLLIEAVDNMLKLNNLVANGGNLKNYDFVKYAKRFVRLCFTNRHHDASNIINEIDRIVKSDKETDLDFYKRIIKYLFDENTGLVNCFTDNSIYSNTNSFHRSVFFQGGSDDLSKIKKRLLKQYALKLFVNKHK